jgi:hypothetical protein
MGHHHSHLGSLRKSSALASLFEKAAPSQARCLQAGSCVSKLVSHVSQVSGREFFLVVSDVEDSFSAADVPSEGPLGEIWANLVLSRGAYRRSRCTTPT